MDQSRNKKRKGPIILLAGAVLIILFLLLPSVLWNQIQNFGACPSINRQLEALEQAQEAWSARPFNQYRLSLVIDCLATCRQDIESKSDGVISVNVTYDEEYGYPATIRAYLKQDWTIAPDPWQSFIGCMLIVMILPHTDVTLIPLE